MEKINEKTGPSGEYSPNRIQIGGWEKSTSWSADAEDLHPVYEPVTIHIDAAGRGRNIPSFVFQEFSQPGGVEKNGKIAGFTGGCNFLRVMKVEIPGHGPVDTVTEETKEYRFDYQS